MIRLVERWVVKCDSCGFLLDEGDVYETKEFAWDYLNLCIRGDEWVITKDGHTLCMACKDADEEEEMIG